MPKTDLKTISSLILTLKKYNYASTGISAVLFSEKVTPRQAYNFYYTLESDTPPQGFIAISNRTQKNDEQGTIEWDFDFSENQAAQNLLKSHFNSSEKNYVYIYLLRLQKWDQQPQGSYYTSLYEPSLEEEPPTGLKMEYESNNYFLKPQDKTVIGRTSISFEIYQKAESGEEIYSPETVNWSYQAYDKDGIPYETSNITYDSNGNFTFTPPFKEGHVEIRAAFEGIDIISKVLFPPKWEGLKSWLVGYAIRMMGTPLIPLAITAYQYNDSTVLPVFSSNLEFYTRMYPNICLVRDPILSDTYYFYCISNFQKYVYDTDSGEVYVTDVSTNYPMKPVAQVYQIDKKLKQWTYIGPKSVGYIDPIWSSCDIKDLEGNIKIKNYKPKPIYGEEGLKCLSNLQN